jgi:hypothetical protein
MLGYLLAGVVGFVLGTVLTCVLLCQKNLETYKQIENKVSNGVSLKDNMAMAKSMYESAVAAYENGDTEDTDNETSSDEEPATDE